MCNGKFNHFTEREKNEESSSFFSLFTLIMEVNFVIIFFWRIICRDAKTAVLSGEDVKVCE